MQHCCRSCIFYVECWTCCRSCKCCRSWNTTLLQKYIFKVTWLQMFAIMLQLCCRSSIYMYLQMLQMLQTHVVVPSWSSGVWHPTFSIDEGVISEGFKVWRTLKVNHGSPKNCDQIGPGQSDCPILSSNRWHSNEHMLLWYQGGDELCFALLILVIRKWTTLFFFFFFLRKWTTRQYWMN